MLKELFFPAEFPIINTERLTLRMCIEADAQNLFLLRSNINVMRHIDREPANDISEAMELIQRVKNSFDAQEGVLWGINIKGNDDLIGTIGLWNMQKEHYRIEIGYMLNPDFWNKGIMSEAMTAANDYAFNVLNFHSIKANINPENIASIKICEKAGFLKEAHFKENYFYKGKFLDSVIYSKLNSSN
jgi:[ribosomal protein S5]-alanine N-acetyltransferase